MTAQALEQLAEAHLGDCCFTAEKMAEMLAISPMQLRELAKNYFKLTPGQFLDDLRLRKAVVLLAKQQPLCEISKLVGYPSVRTFRRCFVRRFGVTPAEFLQLAAGSSAAHELVQSEPAMSNN